MDVLTCRLVMQLQSELTTRVLWYVPVLCDRYIGASKWEDAHILASKYMDPKDVADMYISQAEVFEAKKMYKDAEKLYVQVDEVDLAINMYKKVDRHDDMVRLVRRHHPDLLSQTHRHLGQELEDKQRYSQAEQQYLSAGLWKDAVNMYVTHILNMHMA